MCASRGCDRCENLPANQVSMPNAHDRLPLCYLIHLDAETGGLS